MRMIDEDEVGLKGKPEDTRYIKNIISLSFIAFLKRIFYISNIKVLNKFTELVYIYMHLLYAFNISHVSIHLILHLKNIILI